MIQGAPANILQRPVTVNLGSSDGPPGPGGAQSKFMVAISIAIVQMGINEQNPRSTVKLKATC